MIYAPGMRPKQPQLIEYAGRDLPPNALNGAGGPNSKYCVWSWWAQYLRPPVTNLGFMMDS